MSNDFKSMAEVIEAAMLGVMDLDEAALRWQLFKQRMAVAVADQHGVTEFSEKGDGP